MSDANPTHNEAVAAAVKMANDILTLASTRPLTPSNATATAEMIRRRAAVCLAFAAGLDLAVRLKAMAAEARAGRNEPPPGADQPATSTSP